MSDIVSGADTRSRPIDFAPGMGPVRSRIIAAAIDRASAVEGYATNAAPQWGVVTSHDGQRSQ
jgi:hypothetical protein